MKRSIWIITLVVLGILVASPRCCGLTVTTTATLPERGLATLRPFPDSIPFRYLAHRP